MGHAHGSRRCGPAPGNRPAVPRAWVLLARVPWRWWWPAVCVQGARATMARKWTSSRPTSSHLRRSCVHHLRAPEMAGGLQPCSMGRPCALLGVMVRCICERCLSICILLCAPCCKARGRGFSNLGSRGLFIHHGPVAAKCPCEIIDHFSCLHLMVYVSVLPFSSSSRPRPCQR